MSNVTVLSLSLQLPKINIQYKSSTNACAIYSSFVHTEKDLCNGKRLCNENRNCIKSIQKRKRNYFVPLLVLDTKRGSYKMHMI